MYAELSVEFDRLPKLHDWCLHNYSPVQIETEHYIGHRLQCYKCRLSFDEDNIDCALALVGFYIWRPHNRGTKSTYILQTEGGCQKKCGCHKWKPPYKSDATGPTFYPVSTERGGSSFARFWRQEFGEFPRSAWAVGSYSSGPPAGGTPHVLVFKTLQMTSRPALYWPDKMLIQ